MWIAGILKKGAKTVGVVSTVVVAEQTRRFVKEVTDSPDNTISYLEKEKLRREKEETAKESLFDRWRNLMIR